MSGGMIAIAGRPGSGKTSLMVDLVGEFTRRGLAVSTMMRMADPASIDRPGKDSFRHRAAGAEEVLVTSAQRWALIHGGGAGEHDPLARMAAVDLVIVEGMASPGSPTIEVHRLETAAGRPPLGRDDPAILAVVSDAPLEGLDQPVINLGDAPAVADFIIARLALA